MKSASMLFCVASSPYMAFQQAVKDKDIEGALALRNLWVTPWVARSDSITPVWAREGEGIIRSEDPNKSKESLWKGQVLRIYCCINFYAKCYVTDENISEASPNH